MTSCRAAPDTRPQSRHHAGAGYLTADTTPGTALGLALAGGCADRLSGRHLTAADDLNELLGDVDRIRREDLRILRLGR